MSHFSALTSELGRLSLDLADRAYREGREDEATQFVHLAFTIFEEAYPRCPPPLFRSAGAGPARTQ